MGSSRNDVYQPLLQNDQASISPQASEKNDDGSNELENILSDASFSPLQRYRLAVWIEMKLLFYLAAPAVAVYMINYLMSMSTQIFSGHLGNLELAAASMGNTGIQVFALGLMVEVERMRGRAHDKLMNKIAAARHKAEEKRAAPESKRNRQAAKTEKQSEYIRRTGQIPSSFFCCGWWCS